MTAPRTGGNPVRPTFGLLMSRQVGVLALAFLLASQSSIAARKAWPNSPLPVEVQAELEKAGRFMKSGKPLKAAPMIEATIASADSIPKCLAVADFTETYGYPLMEVRRKCMQKALSLCSSREDFILVALKSRHCQFYEITRECINHLIQNSRTVDDLFDLARKSQEVALNDVAHMAMEKAYTGIKSVDDAVRFAHDVKQMGNDDLVRKVIKDLVNDEENGMNLCMLLQKTEDLGMDDLVRYCLKKALDKAQTVDELKCIYEGSRRNRQNDIMEVAAWRAKKLVLIQRIQNDRAEYTRQLKEWREGREQDLAKQQADAERDMGKDSSGRRFSTGDNKAPENPTSGF